MRIVFVTQGFPPERVGGVEVYLSNLARYILRQNELYIFSRGKLLDKKHLELDVSKVDGLEVSWLRVDLKVHNNFRETYQRDEVDRIFGEYLDEKKPDLVHIHHLGGLSIGMIGCSVARNIPVVMTLHDHQPFCPRGQRIRDDKRVCRRIILDECLECLKPQTVGLHFAGKIAMYLLAKEKGRDILRRMHQDIMENFKKVSRFITPSKFHREKMVEAGVPGDRCLVLPYGLDLSLVENVPPLPKDKPIRRFGYLGTLIPSKGVEDVILAFKRMKTPDCSLHIWGEAVPYHGLIDYDKRLVEMARGANISFYGPYQPMELPDVLNQIDAVVLPSRWYESYGITIREAFKAHRPVIVSDMGAFAEAVEHLKNGLKFPPGDIGALSEMMDRLAQNPELAQKLCQAETEVESLSSHTAKLLALYDEVVEEFKVTK